MTRAWLRIWKRSPLLTAQFAITIAVGMGAVAAVVSLMLALGYQPLPFRDPGQLVAVWERVEPGGQLAAISGPDLEDFAGATQNVFAALGGFVQFQGLLLRDRSGVTKVQACYIQARALGDLGIRPVLGRSAHLDDQPLAWGTWGTSNATISIWISSKLWQSRYAGDPSVIGTTVGIPSTPTSPDETRARVVGVFPSGTGVPQPFGISEPDVWYLLDRDLSSRPRQGAQFFGLGRLRPGVNAVQAQAALATVAETLARKYSFDRRKHPVVMSLDEMAHGPARQTGGLLSLGVALVFVVGCVNLAILMGVEGRRRRQEIAIRAVLGAGRRRLWLEVAAEKCLLTILSLALGAWFASILLRVLAFLVPAAGLGPALLQKPPLSLSVLIGFAVFALAAALIWSALLVSAADERGPSRALVLSSGGRGYTGFSDSTPGAGRWRLILLASQAGIGICLLAAATLTAKTYEALSAANLGPAPRQTVLLSFDVPGGYLVTDAQLEDFNQQMLSRLRQLPGTQSVAGVDHFPPYDSPIQFMKQGDEPGTQRDTTQPMSISPGYFSAMGIPILFGRGFGDADKPGNEQVAIVNLEMAEANWPSPDQAVGSQIAVGSKFQLHYKIVGVAANFTGYWSQKPFPSVYVPEAQYGYCCYAAILRTAGSARTVAALAQQALAGMSTPTKITDISTMQSRWQATLTRPLARVAGMLLLALLGLGLAIQGVYAVAAATVAARRHELAVRSALGAPPGQLAWNVTRALVLAVVVGMGLGIAAALDLRSVLQHWLGPKAVWRVEPLVAAVVLLVAAAAAGCYFPARAATRANPADVLRQG